MNKPCWILLITFVNRVRWPSKNLLIRFDLLLKKDTLYNVNMILVEE